jgi:hypothetical protein
MMLKKETKKGRNKKQEQRETVCLNSIPMSCNGNGRRSVDRDCARFMTRAETAVKGEGDLQTKNNFLISREDRIQRQRQHS